MKRAEEHDVYKGQTANANRNNVDSDTPVIECVGLTHYYGSRLIYSNLNFTVPEGGVVGLLGKNGTGKTTTINILNGFLRPQAGVCRLFGQNSQALPPHVKQRIALLLEGHVQYPFLTIDQAERYLAPFYPKWDSAIYHELTSRLQVTSRQRIGSMSCGQRSQVVLGLILAQNADLLILDDFTLGLDPGYRRLFIDYLQEYVLSRGKTVFVTSHIIQDMERFIQECIIMDYGKILLQMPTRQVLSDLNIYEVKSNDLEGAHRVLTANPDSFYHPEPHHGKISFASFLPFEQVHGITESAGCHLEIVTCRRPTDLEDAFIALTGKY